MPDSPRPFTTRQIAFRARSFRVLQWRADADANQGPPLLFFAGIGANAELMAPFTAALIDRDVVTFDMPGIGESPADGGPYWPREMAEAADHIMRTLGYDQFDAMGVSWGGMLAQQVTLRYPSRVRRLVLAAATAGLFMVPGKVGALALMMNPRKYTDPGFLHRHFDTLFGGGFDGWKRYYRGIRPPTASGYIYQLLALFGFTDALAIPSIKAPTLILAGDDDRLVRGINAHILKTLLPQAELRFVKGAGHMMLLSHLSECAAAVEAFLSDGREPTGGHRNVSPA